MQPLFQPLVQPLFQPLVQPLFQPLVQPLFRARFYCSHHMMPTSTWQTLSAASEFS